MTRGRHDAILALLFVVDGLRPDALPLVATPHIDALIARGASSMQAQATVPSVTLPCHASIFLASGPERHGIASNAWQPPVPPLPGLFEIAHDAGLDTAAFYTWEPLRDLAPPGTLDHAYFRRLGEPHDRHMLEVAQAAAAYVARQPPGLCFIYLEAPDQAGHRFGWMTERYLAAIADCDLALGTVLRAAHRAGHLAEAAIALTSDHGGHDRSHGTQMPEDMTVPWILAGPGAREGHHLSGPLTITDLAPSLMCLLGIDRPAEWLGRVVHEALVGSTQPADSSWSAWAEEGS